jgi:hypothetical protein
MGCRRRAVVAMLSDRASSESAVSAQQVQPDIQVNDYDALRDYLTRQTKAEFVLSFEQIEEIIDAALPRAAQRASWWETLRSPQEKMPQREACLAAGYVATRLADGKNVRFKKMTDRRPRERGDP